MVLAFEDFMSDGEVRGAIRMSTQYVKIIKNDFLNSKLLFHTSIERLYKCNSIRDTRDMKVNKTWTALLSIPV